MNNIYKLCYVEEGNLYFYKGDIEKLHGEGWNKRPYEHNASYPSGSKEDFKTIRAFSEGENYLLLEPKDYDNSLNSIYSVVDLNKKSAPWLKIIDGYAYKNILDVIFAGETFEEIVNKFNKHNIDYVIKEQGLYL